MAFANKHGSMEAVTRVTFKLQRDDIQLEKRQRTMQGLNNHTGLSKAAELVQPVSACLGCLAVVVDHHGIVVEQTSDLVQAKDGEDKDVWGDPS